MQRDGAYLSDISFRHGMQGSNGLRVVDLVFSVRNEF